MADQNLSKLDPKLREAYERVMGTPVPKQHSSSVSLGAYQKSPKNPTLPSTPTAPPSNKPVTTPQPQATTPSTPSSASSPSKPPAPYAPPEQTKPHFVPDDQMTSQPQVSSPQKKNFFVPVLIGIIVLVFIVVYTLFWTKIFNVPLPFLQ